MANAIDIVVNASDRASGKLKGITKTFDSLSAKAEKASGAIMGAMAIGAGALTAVAVAGVKQNSVLEQSEARWTTLLKSSEKAEKQMAWMKDFAKQTPFDYASIDQSATAMMGYGLSLQNVQKWLPALGDASAVLGGGSETVNGLAMAIGQMNAKGKVSAEEMQQLAERGVNAWSYLAEGMGMTEAQVRKLSEEGKLLASDALPHIYAGMQQTFGGGTANLMKSTTGQAMQAKENFSELAGTLTSGAFDWFGANVLPTINNGMAWLTQTFSGGLLQGFQNLWNSSTQAKVVLTALAGIVTGVLVGGLFLLVGAIAPVIGAIATFIAIGMTLSGVALAIASNWSTLAPFFQGIWNVIQTTFSGFLSAFMASWQNLKSSLTPLWESVKTLLASIKPVLVLIGGAVGVLLTVALAVFNGIVAGIVPLVTAFLNLVDTVVNVVKAIAKLLTGDFKGATKAWERATESSINLFKNLWNALKGFFSGFIGTFISILKGFGVDVVGNFKTMMSNGKTAVTDGISNIISGIKGYFTQMVSSGKGLLEAFTDGIKKGISKAVSAVSDGMKQIRDFLPFSPAKKGALSDLDKSGKSFFPTFAGGMAKGTSAMLSMANKGMNELNDILMAEKGNVQLDSFGASLSSRVVHEFRHTGEVEVKGADGTSSKVAVDFVAGSVEERFLNWDDLVSDLRQAVRKR